MDTLGPCRTCRYWSEMIAQCINGVMQAYCLCEASPNRFDYTAGNDQCRHHEAGLPVDIEHVPAGQRERPIAYSASRDD